MPLPRWWRAAGGLLILAAAGSALHAAVSKEYQVKAAFLYNFTKFVEWPPQNLGAEGDPIVIAVLGENPFGDELDNVVRGRKVNGRSISVIELESPADVIRAHVIFVGEGQEALFERFFADTPSGVLTVGETDRFAASGGIVWFTTVGDKVRFEINIASAERAGVKISAQLQKLAIAVHKKS